MNILYKILNETLLQWDDSDIEDTGIIKASDVENSMRSQLIYKVDLNRYENIKIFDGNRDGNSYIYRKFKDNVYINNEHVQLNEYGYTVKEYGPGEYRVYIEDFDKLEKIYLKTFSDCTGLTSITIPDSVTEIGEFAFYGCSGLTSITIPDSVTLIGASAFYNCDGLTSVAIPSSVIRIGNSVFMRCSGLTSITIPDSVTLISGSAFQGCTGLTSVSIPDSVTLISDYAFYGCTSLTSITIPNSVTSIGDYAFENCTSLTSIEIPDSVTKIGNRAFEGCSSLKSVAIPDSVTEIGNGTFAGCSDLTEVTVPNSVTEIGKFAFWNCTGLKKVYVESIDKFNEIYFIHETSNPTYYGAELVELKQGLNEALILWDDSSDIEDTGIIKAPDVENRMNSQLIYKIDEQKSIKIFDNNSFIYEEYKDKVYINDEHVQLEDGYTVNVYELGEYRVYIEDFDKLEELKDFAFYECNELISIIIPNSVTSIGGAAFSYCTGLTSVNIGNSVTSIGGVAFSDCIGLTSITIPNSVTSIGAGAFSSCTGLTSVTIGNSVTWISEGAFEYCSSLISIIIPNSVTRIGEDAFRDCTSLTSVTIPDSVTKIEDSAFYACKELKKVYVENIDKFNKIYFKSNSSNPTYYGAELIELKKGLNEALLQWDNSDIKDSGLIKASDVENRMKYQLVYKIDKSKKIKIFHIDIEDIPDDWWTYSEYKDKVYINGEHVQLEDGYTVNEYEPGEYRVYIEDFDKLEEIEEWTFYECTDLMSIIIPNSVTTIGNGAFSDCTGLTSVTILNSVTEIGMHAFGGCTGLTSVTIPNKVTEISDEIFWGCTGLTSIIIPNSVTKIGNSVFSGCTGLTEVTIPNSVTWIGYHAFFDCPNLKTIYVESISKFKKIESLYDDKIKLIGNVKLIKKQGLNEALLQWDDSDTEDDSYILNQHSIKRSLEGRIDLNDYKKSVAYWQNENYNYPWFKNYINDIINLYFNNKQDFEKYIKTCINDSNGFDRDKDQAIYYSVTNNYGLFIDKLFRMPDESELKAIVDITKYIPLKYQSTFWTIAIFGDKGLIWCIVKHNEK